MTLELGTADGPGGSRVWQAYEAMLFDLDGVITRTATLHAAAWKRLFDEFLAEWATREGDSFEPFDIERDYRVHVDGGRATTGWQPSWTPGGSTWPGGRRTIPRTA